MDDRGSARLTDFGFSTVASDVGPSVGSITDRRAVRWASPETLDREEVSKESDVYSFAMVTFEVCARNTIPINTLTRRHRHLPERHRFMVFHPPRRQLAFYQGTDQRDRHTRT